MITLKLEVITIFQIKHTAHKSLTLLIISLSSSNVFIFTNDTPAILKGSYYLFFNARALIPLLFYTVHFQFLTNVT
jgi:hypothetical protein